MDYGKKAIEASLEYKGKIEVNAKVSINNIEELATAYSPGVAAVSKAIADKKEDVYKYTSKQNLVAVVTDGSAVLGLGNIGPEAAIRLWKGKLPFLRNLQGWTL